MENALCFLETYSKVSKYRRSIWIMSLKLVERNQRVFYMKVIDQEYF